MSEVNLIKLVTAGSNHVTTKETLKDRPQALEKQSSQQLTLKAINLICPM